MVSSICLTISLLVTGSLKATITLLYSPANATEPHDFVPSGNSAILSSIYPISSKHFRTGREIRDNLVPHPHLPMNKLNPELIGLFVGIHFPSVLAV